MIGIRSCDDEFVDMLTTTHECSKMGASLNPGVFINRNKQIVRGQTDNLLGGNL